MSPLELLRAGTSLFRARLAGVSGAQWAAPTPCAGWTVLDLVNHVVYGNRLAVDLLDGRTPDTRPPATAGEVVAAVDRTAAEQDAAFRRTPGDREVPHPAGRVRVSDFVVYRCADIVVHAWDLARATGGDTDLGPVLPDAVLRPYAEWVDSLDRDAVFAPPASVAPDAPEQDRLLTRLGRTP